MDGCQKEGSNFLNLLQKEPPYPEREGSASEKVGGGGGGGRGGWGGGGGGGGGGPTLKETVVLHCENPAYLQITYHYVYYLKDTELKNFFGH